MPISKAVQAVTFSGKYRHNWYQLQNKVTVDVYAKGVSKDQVSVTFEPERLLVVIAGSGPEEEEYRLDVQLYGKVQPDACRYEVLKTKVEISMNKADTRQWVSVDLDSVHQ